jgi:glycerophosphoryl diester phosphodiesterase
VRSVTLDVQDTKDGAVVTMHPRRADDADSIRKQVRKRLAGG